MDARLQMYRELTEACGVPGYEQPVREVMRRYLAPFGELVTDHLGSIVVRKAGRAGGPKVLVAGHMDEVGFMVAHITERGFLRLQPLGGWWPQVLPAQRVCIRTHRGEVIGIIGSRPPHTLTREEWNQVTPVAELFVDIGAGSRDEAMEFGVRPGDPVVPICPFTLMPNPKLMMAKAWDNRAGCAAAIQVLEELRGADHPNVVYAGATVQAEVGARGAETLAHAVQPDVALVLDVAVAGDTPGFREDAGMPRLGRGPAVVLYDAMIIPNLRLRDLVVETAAAEGIPIQFEVTPRGGHDGMRVHMHMQGVPTVTIGIPARYIHSHAGLVHRDDLNHAARLAAAVIRRLDAAAAAMLRQV